MESRKLKTEFQSQRKPGTRPERKGGRKEYLKAFNEFWQRQEEDMANTLAELSLCGDDKMESQDKDSISNQNVECNPTETGGGIPVSFSDSRIDSSPVNLEFRDSSSVKSEEFNGVLMFEDINTAVEKPTSSFVTDVVNSNKPKRKLKNITRARYSFKPGNGTTKKLYRRKPRQQIWATYLMNHLKIVEKIIRRHVTILYYAMEKKTCTSDDN